MGRPGGQRIAGRLTGSEVSEVAMTERKYLYDIRKKCKALGVWRDEFERTQHRLARIYVRIDQVELAYEADGGEPVITHTNRAGAENPTKSPYLTELDFLYDQALQYEREMGLTPAALRKINESALKDRESSPMADALRLVASR